MLSAPNIPDMTRQSRRNEDVQTNATKKFLITPSRHSTVKICRANYSFRNQTCTPAVHDFVTLWAQFRKINCLVFVRRQLNEHKQRRQGTRKTFHEDTLTGTSWSYARVLGSCPQWRSEGTLKSRFTKTCRKGARGTRAVKVL